MASNISGRISTKLDALVDSTDKITLDNFMSICDRDLHFTGNQNMYTSIQESEEVPNTALDYTVHKCDNVIVNIRVT